MLEQIQQLEERLERLAGLLEATRQHNANLQRENAAQGDELEALKLVKAHNAELEQQVQQLEDKLEEMVQREATMRTSLDHIFQRIDGMANEFGQMNLSAKD